MNFLYPGPEVSELCAKKAEIEMMSACTKLLTQAENLKRKSIYILPDDNDRDFEFFVFVDPANPQERPPFLQELYHSLTDKEKDDHSLFADAKHQSELEKLLCNMGIPVPSQTLNSLDWLKIAIEEYSFRLFVVINKSGWRDKEGFTPFENEFWFIEGLTSSDSDHSKTIYREVNDGECVIEYRELPRKWKKSEFLYKRICWIDAEEFNEIVSNLDNRQANKERKAFTEIKSRTGKSISQEVNLTFWLYLKWITHVARRIRNLTNDSIVIEFSELQAPEEKENLYFPSTLPGVWKAPLPSNEENSIRIDLKNQQVYFDKSDAASFVYFIRHRNVFSLEGRKWAQNYGTKQSQTIYGENLSGILSYFTRISDATRDFRVESALFFVFGLVEAALLRILIMDERLQEWFGKLNANDAGNLFQQRVSIGFLNGPKEYEQKDKPHHKYYSNLKIYKNGSQVRVQSALHSDRQHAFEKIFVNDPLGAGVDISILHQGILDKWKADSRLSTAVFEIKEKIPFLLITSGRGTPANLPKGIKFLPFSGLEACMIGTKFEKFTLVKQLFSI